MRRLPVARAASLLLVVAVALPLLLLSGCGGDSNARLALIGTWLLAYRRSGSDSWQPVPSDETVYLSFFANNTYRRDRYIGQDRVSFRSGTWVREGSYLTLRINDSSTSTEIGTYREGQYSLNGNEDRLTIHWFEFDPPDEYERYDAY